MLIGYVRVSTNDQNTDLQRNALNCVGCELIFEEVGHSTFSSSQSAHHCIISLRLSRY